MFSSFDRHFSNFITDRFQLLFRCCTACTIRAFRSIRIPFCIGQANDCILTIFTIDFDIASYNGLTKNFCSVFIACSEYSNSAAVNSRRIRLAIIRICAYVNPASVNIGRRRNVFIDTGKCSSLRVKIKAVCNPRIYALRFRMHAAILSYGKFIANAERSFITFRRAVKGNLMLSFAQYDIIVQVKGQVRTVLGNLDILFSIRIIRTGEIYRAAGRDIYSVFNAVCRYLPAVIIRIFNIIHGCLQLFFRCCTACTIRAFRSIWIPFCIGQANDCILTIFTIDFDIASYNGLTKNFCSVFIACSEYSNSAAVNSRRIRLAIIRICAYVNPASVNIGRRRNVFIDTGKCSSLRVKIKAVCNPRIYALRFRMHAAILSYGKFITNAERSFVSFRRTVKRNLMVSFAQYNVVI